MTDSAEGLLNLLKLLYENGESFDDFIEELNNLTPDQTVSVIDEYVSRYNHQDISELKRTIDKWYRQYKTFKESLPNKVAGVIKDHNAEQFEKLYRSGVSAIDLIDERYYARNDSFSSKDDYTAWKDEFSFHLNKALEGAINIYAWVLRLPKKRLAWGTIRDELNKRGIGDLYDKLPPVQKALVLCRSIMSLHDKYEGLKSELYGMTN